MVKYGRDIPIPGLPLAECPRLAEQIRIESSQTKPSVIKISTFIVWITTKIKTKVM